MQYEVNMSIIANLLVGIVAIIHLVFAYKEFTSRNKPDLYAKFEIILAKDQALDQIGRILANAAAFNALLGIGLFVTLIVGGGQAQLLKVYLLISIIIAGIVGGLTLKPIVAKAQSIPAAIALLSVLLA